MTAAGGTAGGGGRSPTGGTTAAGGAISTGGTRPDAGADSRTDSGVGMKDGPGAGGALAAGGSSGAGGSSAACTLPDLSKIQNDLSLGGGGTQYKTSDHFVLFGSTSVDAGLNLLEAAHQCFVEEWCWRSPGLSTNASNTGYYRFNAYEMSSLSGGAAGLTPYDATTGLAYEQVLPSYITEPGVTVHEFGHALTYSEKNWIYQGRTGYWWESVANFVADTFMTSPICANARSQHGITTIHSLLEPDVTISNSYYVIVMDQNYYQAWPFLTYLTNNPDNYSGLGQMTVPNLMRTYKLDSNETPLHTLERLAAPVTVQTIVGRYWARMAYLDIDDTPAQEAFMSARSTLDFKNLSASGNQTYTVLAARQPRYFGANIIPLEPSGDGAVSVQITNLASGQSTSGFTATLAIRASKAGSVRYVDLPGGSGQATIASTEEASLVVVNTPAALLLYDPSSIPANDPVNTGLSYQVQLTGATPAN